jgi:hypothetical protein
MIATLTEIKSLLNYTDTTYDNFINDILSVIDDRITVITRNHFINLLFDFIESSSISFSTVDNSINMTDIHTYDLAVGDTIRIYDSLKNNKMFTIASITTDKLIVSETVKNESAEQYVKIALLDFPESLKQVVADIVRYRVEKQNIAVKTEKIDDYSITYTAGEFPDQIMKALYNYRCLSKT